MPPVRRLAAIMAADVAGYSRLMGTDEEGTHYRLQAHLRELVNPKIGEHRGRIVKNTGDGLLAEFSSVVDAARCAVEIQRGMADREPEVSEERRTKFRIGINLGDVITEHGDIFGDGVNVAARLEALAEPGGVFVSNTVYDQVRDRLPFTFEDLGEQQVKNITRPVQVFALHPEVIAELPAAGMPIAMPRRSIVSPITAAVAGVLVIAAIVWWVWPAMRSSSSTPTAVATATSVAQPSVAPRLSIVVLPFANLSNDPDQQYFADGITEDLTTDLSRIANMLVISRNTAFTYRNKPSDTKQIGRELGVRYVLEGSVRRLGNQVRVSAQLINAETDVHLWAERFDGDTSDLFALQNEITSRIAIALGVELTGAEAARPTEHPDALDYILRGRAAANKVATRDTRAEGISMYERALALNPRSAEAQAGLAGALTGRAMDGMADSAAADIARAERLVDQALAVSPRSPYAHYIRGQVLRARAQVLREEGRCEEAIPEYETAIALNRNLVFPITAVGWCKLLTGSMEEVIPRIEQAIRLSPQDPAIPIWYQWIGLVHLLRSHTDEAIVWLEKARNANPVHPGIRANLASAYGLKGETERGAAELAEARRLSPNGRFSSVARLKSAQYFGVPKVRALFEAAYVRGLRLAGMPEE